MNGLLSLVIFLPVVGALLLLFVGNRDGERNGFIRQVALGVSLLTFVGTLALWRGFDPARRRLPVRRAALLDSDLRHRLLRRHRRHQPDAGRARPAS